MLNKILIEGNLVADPETVQVGTGSVTKFRLGCTRHFWSAPGERRSKATFIDCVAWNAVGQSLSRSFRKGSAILLDGRLEFDEWVAEGKRHSRHFIDIQEFHHPRGQRAPSAAEQQTAVQQEVAACAG